MITISKIKTQDYTLKFIKPFELEYRIEDGTYYCEYVDLAIYSCGETLKELKKDFKDDVSESWEMFVECDIYELSDDAVVIRNNLLRLIEKVKE